MSAFEDEAEDRRCDDSAMQRPECGRCRNVVAQRISKEPGLRPPPKDQRKLSKRDAQPSSLGCATNRGEVSPHDAVPITHAVVAESVLCQDMRGGEHALFPICGQSTCVETMWPIFFVHSPVIRACAQYIL